MTTTEPAEPADAASGPQVDTSDLLLESTADATYTSTDSAKLRTALVHINGDPFYFVEPDSGVQMDLEEAKDTRAMLRLLAGRFWCTAMKDAIDSLSREDAIDMVDTVGSKFEIDESVMNRATGGSTRRERRARRRGRGRR